jgi:hypothetical protein
VTTSESDCIEQDLGATPDDDLYVLTNRDHAPKGDTGAELKITSPGR